jgi:flagellar hook-associated protein 2
MSTSSITAPTYDPTTTAKALADKYVEGTQTKITNDTNTATATAKALTTLSSAISAFQTSLAGIAGIGKSMLAQSATVSDTTIGSATAKSNAPAGTYSLFVSQLATSSQVSYNSVPAATTPTTGYLTINLADEGLGTNTAHFDVQLDAGANTDSDPKLSVREIAAAINNASGNAGKVSAGVVTVNNVQRLVLTSTATGKANTVSVDAANSGDGNLQTAFDISQRTTMKTAQDAIFYLDPNDPTTKIPQASNTFTNIDGVAFTATKAQAPGSDPITLTVGRDTSGTAKNVQSFVDAYNKLKAAVDGLVSAGDPANKVAAGAFAHDSGVLALRNRLVDLIRPAGTLSLASYGITASRDGTLSLDSTRLEKQLTANPTGLDTLIGNASTSAPSGITGAMNTYLNQWSNTTTGQIKTRTDANTKLQSGLTQRQSDLDSKYDAAYQRYLKQYTDLQTLQAKMQNNSSMFSSLFSNDSNS